MWKSFGKNELVNFNFKILPATDHIPISQKVPTSDKKNAKYKWKFFI